MKKRVLSLLLCFVLAAGLLSVCAPPAQAGTIAGVVEQFLNQPDQIKKLFGKEVAHGDCGPAENEASVRPGRVENSGASAAEPFVIS